MLAPAEDTRTIVIDEFQAREWELQIELDLMADQVTFPYVLRCQAGASGMEVRGYVPNALVRERALAIARKSCPIEVVNAMVLLPNIQPAAPGRVQMQEVQNRLTRAPVKNGNVVEVELGPNGEVILTGRAASQEEKVILSRALRGLPGCSAVKNELAAPAGSVSVPVMTVAIPPAPARETKPAFVPDATPAEVARSSDNPLLPPRSRPARPVRDSRPPDVAQLPPPPVTPNKQADFRPESPLAASAPDRPEPVVQASKNEAKDARPAAPAGSPQQAAASRPMPQALLSARTQQALKQRIRTALGPAVRNLDMKFDGNGGLKLIVHVTSKTPDVERIASVILAVPEFQHFDVTLEFRTE
jgi:hypothetical protein